VSARLTAADGTSQAVRARYLVAADGASSRIRAAIGQDFTGRTYPEDWLIIDARDVANPIDHIEFVCDPRRPSPHMVAPGQRERWEFMLRPGEKREEMERPEAIRELLAPWGDAANMHIERKAVYRFHARCCDSFSKGRVFLAGDAAHITPPFVGQGLVAGLRDAANLAWKLAAVTRGRATPSILATYDQERRPHARAMIDLAKLMGRFVMPATALHAMVFHGLLRMLRLVPPLRRWFDHLGLKPKNQFRRGLFIRARRPLVGGGQLPQSWVRDHRGAPVLSDAMLGDGLTLIGFGLDPAAYIGDAAGAEWRAAGGTIAQLCHPGQALHRRDDAHEDLQGLIVPARVPCGWVAVVRPDRVVLHQGPAEQAERLVSEALDLLGRASAIVGQASARQLAEIG
jgi:3-(3-hydroxy-phenyl)propionate hydroxylase